jgi:broad specificity phosphatase PhoE
MSTIRRIFGVLAALLLAAGLTAAPASASPDITITFVRHGESHGNVSGAIDTLVPGPSLTPKGEQQAKEAAAELSRTPHDGVYASSMIRTQQTAQPLADQLGLPIAVMPGLREIEAGDFEGQSEKAASTGTASHCSSGWQATAPHAYPVRSTATSSTRGSTRPWTPFTGAASSGRSRTRTARPSRCGR